MTERFTEQIQAIFASEAAAVLQAAGQARAEIQPLVERSAPLAARIAAGRLSGVDTSELERDLRAIGLNLAAKGAVAAQRQLQARFESILVRAAAAISVALA